MLSFKAAYRNLAPSERSSLDDLYEKSLQPKHYSRVTFVLLACDFTSQFKLTLIRDWYKKIFTRLILTLHVAFIVLHGLGLS